MLLFLWKKCYNICLCSGLFFTIVCVFHVNAVVLWSTYANNLWLYLVVPYWIFFNIFSFNFYFFTFTFYGVFLISYFILHTVYTCCNSLGILIANATQAGTSLYWVVEKAFSYVINICRWSRLSPLLSITYGIYGTGRKTKN